MRQVGSLEYRFLGLVMTILLLAIASATVAVWQSARPFLINIQNDALVEQAEKTAAKMERVLGQNQQFLAYIASFPDVVGLAVGNVTDQGIVLDYLSSRNLSGPIDRISLYDVLEDEILRFAPKGTSAANYSDEEIQLYAIDMLNDASPTGQILSYGLDGTTYHFLSAIPILQKGHVEGVMIAESHFDREQLFQLSDLVSAISITGSDETDTAASEDTERVSSAIGDTGLAVVVVPNRATAFAAGKEMIGSVASWVAAVLIVPFALFALIGRKELVQPHIELQKSEELLRKQKKELSELAAVAEKASDAIVVTDLESRIVWANPAFQAISGRTPDEIIGRVPGKLLAGPDTDPKQIERIAAARRDRQPYRCELQIYDKAGRIYWISMSMSPLLNDQKEAYGFFAISRDITDGRRQRDALVQAKADIEAQALRDPLTDLPNRRALDRAVSDRLLSGSAPMTMVRIDLDHFKYVNDTLGHEAGDFALIETARILRSEIRSDDLAARVGGDEFVILLAPGATVATAVTLSERLRECIRLPMDFNGKPLQLGASFGVASDEGNWIDRDAVSVSADAALYLAKDKGRNRIEVYAPAVHRDVVEKRDLAAEIRLGIREREFVPFFQPQVDAETFEICGAETLARWANPRRGLLPPGLFLPIAEQLSVIEEIDEIVFESALTTLTELGDDGLSLPKVSFNVTAQRLTDPSILEIVRKLAPEGTTIAFEILESVLLEEKMADLSLSVDLLREFGIEIEIDDFGSGHASIIGLLRAAPDTMKIDQRLVAPLAHSKSYQQMVKSIVEIGRSQNIKIIAEGVETEAHALILRDLKVDCLQGYYFAKPMCAEDLRTYLQEHAAPGAHALRAVGGGKSA